eukprot:4060292-Ditylum_brightwellii.AAC.1
MVGVVEAEGVTVDVEVGTKVADVMVVAVAVVPGTQLADDQKDKVNKLRTAFRDNKCKMAAANSDNRDSEDKNQAGNAMNCKKRSGKQD